MCKMNEIPQWPFFSTFNAQLLMSSADLNFIPKQQSKYIVRAKCIVNYQTVFQWEQSDMRHYCLILLLQMLPKYSCRRQRRRIFIAKGIESIYLLSCQSRVTVTSCFVYKVIRDLESIDHLCINPIRRIGLKHN